MKISAFRLDGLDGEFAQGDYVRKFGRNDDVDSAAIEDIWDVGGAYSWPAAAATTTIVSDSAEDKTGATGALTVAVFGLDSSFNMINETVTMNGTDAVTLSSDYLRVYRAFVVTVGSNETNVGDIQVLHGATVLAQITAGNGQTLMCIYTTPRNFTGYVLDYYASVNKKNTGSVDIILKTRTEGGAWRVRQVIGSISGGTSNVVHQFQFPIKISEKTDVLISANASTNDLDVSAGFNIFLHQAE